MPTLYCSRLSAIIRPCLPEVCYTDRRMVAQPATSSRAPLGLLLIIAAATLWGTVGIATRALYELAPTNALSIGFFRLALAVPALVLATHLMTGSVRFATTRCDLWLMLGLGIAMAAYQVFYFAAIGQVGVTIAVLVNLCSAPVMVALFSAVLLRERPTVRVGIAMLCAVVGTVLLVNARPGDAAVAGSLALGVGLALLAGLSYATVTLFSRALAPRYHPLQPIMVGFALGAVTLLPFALAGGLVVTYPAVGWLLLLHLGLIPTALGYLLFLGGLRSTTATAASIATLFEPLTSTVLAWWLFDERLGIIGVAGGLLLIAAMVVLAWQPTRQSG